MVWQTVVSPIKILFLLGCNILTTLTTMIQSCWQPDNRTDNILTTILTTLTWHPDNYTDTQPDNYTDNIDLTSWQLYWQTSWQLYWQTSWQLYWQHWRTWHPDNIDLTSWQLYWQTSWQLYWQHDHCRILVDKCSCDCAVTLGGGGGVTDRIMLNCWFRTRGVSCFLIDQTWNLHRDQAWHCCQRTRQIFVGGG